MHRLYITHILKYIHTYTSAAYINLSMDANKYLQTVLLYCFSFSFRFRWKTDKWISLKTMTNFIHSTYPLQPIVACNGIHTSKESTQFWIHMHNQQMIKLFIYFFCSLCEILFILSHSPSSSLTFHSCVCDLLCFFYLFHLERSTFVLIYTVSVSVCECVYVSMYEWPIRLSHTQCQKNFVVIKIVQNFERGQSAF